MQNQQASSTKIPLAEKLVAGLGMLLVLATFAYLLQRAVREQTPPQFVGRIETVVPSGDVFIAKVLIKNIGGTPVTKLRVAADFGDGEKSREATIDYLPSNSERRVGFVLKETPNRTTANFTFVSYGDP